MARDTSGKKPEETSASDLAERESGNAVGNESPTAEELELRKATFQTLLDWIQSQKEQVEADILAYVRGRIIGFEADTGLQVWGLHSSFDIVQSVSGNNTAHLRSICIDIDLNNRNQRSSHLTFEFTDHRHPAQRVKEFSND